MRELSGALVALIGLCSYTADATLISHHGRLLENGVPLNTPVDLRFRLYEGQSAEFASWEETHTDQPCDAGYYNVVLGVHSVLNAEDLFAMSDPYLGVFILDASQQEIALKPRLPVTDVPYAAVSEWAHTAANLECKECVVAEEVDFSYAGSYLKNGPAIGLECLDVCVQTPELADAAVISSKLADFAVTESHIAEAAVTPQKLAACPGSQATGLLWDGASWVCAQESFRRLQSVSGTHEDGLDTGYVPGRVLDFVKTRHDTAIRITYVDNWRVAGNATACAWSLHIDESVCSTPGDLTFRIFDHVATGTSTNHHRNGTYVGSCSGLSAGNHQLKVYVQTAPSYSNADCFTGWNGTRWYLEVEEVYN